MSSYSTFYSQARRDTGLLRSGIFFLLTLLIFLAVAAWRPGREEAAVASAASVRPRPVRPLHPHRRRVILAEAMAGEGERARAVEAADRRAQRVVQVAAAAASGTTPGGKSKVVPVRSRQDGQIYLVAADLPDRAKAADKLAEMQRRSQTLLQAVSERLEGSARIVAEDGVDITDNMKQLVRRHHRQFTPFAEYHNPGDKTVGSNSDKGTMIETCLREKQDPSQWNSDNTLFRVHVHELAHSSDFDFRGDGDAAHGPVFHRLHRYLLGVAQELGIYDCEAYIRSGRRFCGLQLTEDFCGEENPAQPQAA
jgi:hypothetical protein